MSDSIQNLADSIGLVLPTSPFTKEFYDEHGDALLKAARDHVQAKRGDTQLEPILGFQCTAEELVSWAELLMGSFPESASSHCGDVLIRGFSGYWAQGWSNEDGRGWLVIDHEDFEGSREDLDALVERFESEDGFTQADIDMDNVYIIGASVAIRSLKWGRAKWGKDFDNGVCDYGQNDCGVQAAIFGEVIYG